MDNKRVDRTNQLTQPFVKVIDAGSGLEIDNYSSTGVGITYFRYIHKDEDPDECEITIESDNYEKFKALNVSYGTMFRCIWGYIKGLTTPPVTVVVRDMDVKYGPNATWIRLSCSDLTSFLYSVSGSESENMNILNYLREKCLNTRGIRYTVTIIENGNIVYRQGRKKITNSLEESEETIVTDETIKDVTAPPDMLRGLYEPMLKPVKDKVNSRNIDARPFVSDNNPMRFKHNKDWVPEIGPDGKFIKPVLELEEPNEPIPGEGELSEVSPEISQQLLDFLLKERPFLEANRSPIQNLRDAFRGAPSGPWYVSGRSDSIVIHNRDLFKRPYKKYEYRRDPVDLVDLNIRSNYEDYDNNMLSSGVVDGYTGNYLGADLWLQSLGDIRDFREILADEKTTRDQKLKQLQAWYKAFEDYEKYRIKTHEVRPYKTKEGGFQSTQGSQSNYVAGMDPGVGITYKKSEKIYDKPYIIYTTPIMDEGEQRNQIRNTARSLEMDKIKMDSAIFTGDVFLTSDQVIFISNLIPIHNGCYYINEAIHTLSSDGYKVTAKGFRVRGVSGAMETFLKAEPGISEDINENITELWIRQQNLFLSKHRYDILITGESTEEVWYKYFKEYRDSNFLGKEDSPRMLRGTAAELAQLYSPQDIINMFYNGKLVFSKFLSSGDFGDIEQIPSSVLNIDEILELDMDKVDEEMEQSEKIQVKKGDLGNSEGDDMDDFVDLFDPSQFD